MDSATNHLVKNVNNSGGTSATTANNRLVGNVGEAVAFTTAASAGNASVSRGGWSELHAFPNKVQDLSSANPQVSSVTVLWTTPGYDGVNGALQVGSTYYVRIASYTVPDTFSDHRLANISFSTSGVNPGDPASITLLGLNPATTYYARIWTTDGDSNVSYESNITSFTMLQNTAPPAPGSGAITASFVSSVTATYATSVGANSYLVVASTQAGLSPVWASSSTANSTATTSGLDPNTTYYVGVAACNPFCSGFTNLGSTVTLAAPAVSLTTTTVSSSTIGLVWGGNGNPSYTRYLVRSSTDNVSFISMSTVTALTKLLTDTQNGILNATTYYFEIVALNEAGLSAPPSNRITVRTPVGPVPFPPSNLAATAILLGVDVTWDALGPGQTGVGLKHYRLERSTNAGFGFVLITTTSALSYRDRPLTLGPTYYYRIQARDLASVDSAYSSTVAAVPFTLAPMEPLGVNIVPGPTTVSLSWSTTTRYGDGHLFISTAAPLADELIGYAVYRSTEGCAPSFVNIASQTATSLVDNTGGINYYYRVHSYNSVGLSTTAVTISSLGERSYYLEDCVSKVVLDANSAASLNASVNGVGDIRIDRTRLAADVHDGVFQSVAFVPMMNGVTPLTNYPMPKPARIVLAFQTAGGVPVSSTAAPAGSGVTVKNLGLFWFNGSEFKKVYGTVDPVTQTVTVESPNLGNYQIRALSRADGTVFDVSNISGRVLTPNGDGLNDVIIFTYDPGPNRESVTGRIYDVMGQYVAEMTAGQVPNTLVWDARSNGRVVGSGAYVYRISGGGKSYTGTVVVAR